MNRTFICQKGEPLSLCNLGKSVQITINELRDGQLEVNVTALALNYFYEGDTRPRQMMAEVESSTQGLLHGDF